MPSSHLFKFSNTLETDFLTDYVFESVLLSLTSERIVAHEEVVQHDPAAPDVTGGRVPPSNHFRSHVGVGPHLLLVLQLLRLEGSRQAEIDKPDVDRLIILNVLQIVDHHHVFQLYVAVDYALGFQVGQHTEEFAEDYPE